MTNSTTHDWITVTEHDGTPRTPYPGERWVTGYITSEIKDLQGDVVHLAKISKKLPVILRYAIASWNHGMDKAGQADFIHVGRFVKYRIVDKKIEAMVSIYPDEFSPLINKCWEEMRTWPHGGFSLGGRSIDRICDKNGCHIPDADVIEIACTPSPANQEALYTGGNFMAKNLKLYKTAQEAVLACKECADEVDRMVKVEGKTVAYAMTNLQSLIDSEQTQEVKKMEKEPEKEEKKESGKEPKKEDSKEKPKEEQEVKKATPEVVASAPTTAGDDANAKILKSILEAVTALSARVEKIEAGMKPLKKAEPETVKKDEPAPAPKEAPKEVVKEMDDKSMIETLTKKGFTVQGPGIVHSTTPPPPVQPATPPGLKSKSKKQEDFEKAVDASRKKC